jgi:hypothetical protein
MKKTISTAITLLSFFMANAQIERGANTFGVNLGASYIANFNSIQSNTSMGLKAQPIFEHFIDKNLSLGIGLNYGVNLIYSDYSVAIVSYNTSYNTQNIGAQIQLKKYWFVTNKTAFTLTPIFSSNYNETNVASSYTDGSKSTSNFNNWVHSANCNIGASYFIKKNLAIEAQTTPFSYSFTPEKSNNGNTNNINLSIVPNNLLLGFKYFFEKK